LRHEEVESRRSVNQVADLSNAGENMATERASLETIHDFLAQKRIAIAGISRNPASFSVVMFRELQRRGYDVVPVNPNAAELQGQTCFARMQDIQPPVDAALLMTSPDATESVVNDCAAANIKRVWMYKAAGKGAVSEKAVAKCRQLGIQIVPGECPFMFLPETERIHRFHGFFRELTGRYPRRAAA
jgi:predicted CoA-binding protein